MTKRYTGPVLKPKKHVVPSKYRVPVLTDKAPPPKKGHRYSSTGLRSENRIDTGRSKPRTGWGRFFRFGGGGGSDSPGQPGLKHGKRGREPKLQ